MVAQYMPQPFKHPKTGVYYYRKVVPFQLRKTLGRTEFRISLRTKDLREAKLRYPEQATEVDARLTHAAGGPVSLTGKQVAALAGRWYRRMLDEYGENPGDPENWELWQDQLRDAYYERRIAAAVKPEVDELLRSEGLILDARSRQALDEALLMNGVKLTGTLIRRAGGDYKPDPFLETIPEWQRSEGAAEQGEVVAISTVFEAWAAERQFSAKTRYSWERTLGKLTMHLGHEDAGKITDTDIIGWKEALIGSRLSPKTIKNYLTIIKTFFRWASKNKRIATNPAADVEYRAKPDPATARLSYSEDDAKRILTAARHEKEAHKRWVPWLAAFTGARCDELCGAMATDVRIEDGVQIIRIDPVGREEGGSVKNRASIRSVPLHPALAAEGFLDYVAALPKDGPLFPKVGHVRQVGVNRGGV